MGFKITNEDLERACDIVVWESLIPDREEGVLPNPTSREDHVGPLGWYSSEVMAEALRQTLYYQLELQPIHMILDLIDDETIVGAIMNQNNEHWVALKKVGGRIWLLNSTERAPQPITFEEYTFLVRQFVHTYPIRRL